MLRLFTAVSMLTFMTACAGGSETRASVGPAGEVLHLTDGLTLDVPAGAVPAGVELTVRDLFSSPGEHELSFEPQGLQLSAPLTLNVVDDDGVTFVAEQELEIEHAQTHSALRFSTLGHLSLRKSGSAPSNARKHCKWFLVSSDPATRSSVWECVLLRGP